MDSNYEIPGLEDLKVLLELVDQYKKQSMVIQACYNALKKLKDHHIESIQFLKSREDELSCQANDLTEKLKDAQKLLYVERQKTSAAVKDRNTLLSKLNTARDIVRDINPRNGDVRDKLSFLNDPTDATERLETILELNNTDYLMSELSYTFDEDESCSENSIRRSRRNKRAPCRFPHDEPLDVSKPKRSRGKKSPDFEVDGERVIATTTVTVPHNGPVSAKSVIESFPSNSKQQIDFQKIDSRFLPSAPPISLDSDSDEEDHQSTPRSETPKRPLGNRINNIRMHKFIQKSHIMGETCSACSKKMKFSTVAVKCTNCKAIAHTNCKEKVPLPCVPVALNTPNNKSCKTGTIADFAPQTTPKVPALIIHCIREVERRGLQEVGLYRVPGSDKEVKTLKEKLVKAKGVIDLANVNDIHTICGCLKEFLRSLKERLIPQKLWKEFSAASEIADDERKKNKLFNLVNGMPVVNRDTLAYIVLHLQKVAMTPTCKMPVANLSKMFGPTIVGYSANEAHNILLETNISNQIMADLMLMPTECWESILYPENSENTNPEMFKTPSQSSVLGFFTNSTSSVKTVRKFNFFNTP